MIDPRSACAWFAGLALPALADLYGDRFPKASAILTAKAGGVALGDYARMSKADVVNRLVQGARFAGAPHLAIIQRWAKAAAGDAQIAPPSSAPAPFDDLTGREDEVPPAPTTAQPDPDAVRRIADELDEVRAQFARRELKALGAELRAEIEARCAPQTIVVQSPAHPAGLDVGAQHAQFGDLLAALASGLNVLLLGPAGGGKTHAAEAAARALGLPFFQSGAVGSRYDLSGFVDAGGTYQPTDLYRAVTEGGVFLQDEADASDPNANLWLNSLFANRYASFPGQGVVRAHESARFLFACNTLNGATGQFNGRFKLDAATADRFVVLNWQYDEQLEMTLALRWAQDEAQTNTIRAWVGLVQGWRRAATKQGLKATITPRASYDGARLLAQGVDVSKVKLWTVANKLAPDHAHALGVAA